MLHFEIWQRLLRCGLAWLALAAVAVEVEADVIVLKNGNEIRGRITLDTPDLIEVQVPFGNLQILRREIARIEKEGEAEFLEKTGERLLRHRHTDEGLAHLRKSYELEPSTRTRQSLVRGLATVAAANVERRLLGAARANLDEALILAPEDPALLELESTLEREATRQRTLAEAAQVALDEAKYDAAYRDLSTLVAEYPDARTEWREPLAKAAVLTGHERLRASDFVGASERYRVALREEPDFVELLSAPLALAETRSVVPLLEAGRYAEAVRRLTDARELLPDQPAVLYYLAVASEGAGDVAAAAELYAQLAGPEHRTIQPEMHMSVLRRAAEATLGRAGKIDLVAPRARWEGHAQHPGSLESRHFEISYRIAERAKAAARQLEHHLTRLEREWCRGHEVISKRIPVYLYADRESYRAAVSPPEWSPAITRNERRFGRLLRQEMHFDASAPQFESSTIAHELCHILLPHIIGEGKSIPLWIDEGLATSEEPLFKQQYFDRVVREALQSGSLFPLSELTTATDYPSPDRAALFYAQSNSVIRFLRARMSMKSLFAFISEAADGKLSAAISRHTRYGGVDHLEREWKRQLSP